MVYSNTSMHKILGSPQHQERKGKWCLSDRREAHAGWCQRLFLGTVEESSERRSFSHLNARLPAFSLVLALT